MSYSRIPREVLSGEKSVLSFNAADFAGTTTPDSAVQRIVLIETERIEDQRVGRSEQMTPRYVSCSLLVVYKRLTGLRVRAGSKKGG